MSGMGALPRLVALPERPHAVKPPPMVRIAPVTKPASVPFRKGGGLVDTTDRWLGGPKGKYSLHTSSRTGRRDRRSHGELATSHPLRHAHPRGRPQTVNDEAPQGAQGAPSGSE